MSGKINGACDAILFGYMPRFLRRTGRALRRNMRKILYYGGMLAILAVIAIAAEEYRQRAGESAPAKPDVAPAAAVQEADPIKTVMLAELMPEDAQLLRPYSEDMLWNAELARWEGHMAEDYAVEAVYSLTGGVVADAGRDGRYGGYVRVKSDACEILYASLRLEEGVAPGMQVQPGELLGYADSSMPGEAYMGAHLHLELELLERRLNPKTFALEIDLVD